MTERTFAMYARMFEGVATVGRYSSEEGLLVVDVWPVVNGQLPALDKVHQARAIGDEIEDRLGVVVSVKVHDRCPQRAIA